jgi:hypothetical protein
LFVHVVRLADSRAACTAGNNSAINNPMIAMTTSNSTRVNPKRGAARRAIFDEKLPMVMSTVDPTRFVPLVATKDLHREGSHDDAVA